VSSGQSDSWQKRYEAAKARDEQQSAAWVRRRFGGPVGQTLVKELPLLGFVFLIGLLTLGWKAGLINVVLLLIVVLGFRSWARRRYGLTSPRRAPGSPAGH
jgi:hypothetical protein